MGLYASNMALEQVSVNLPQPLLSELDALVASGAYKSRDAAVLAGIEAITRFEDRKRTDRAIVEGYRRMPLSAAEEAVENAVARASLRESILEEPW